MRILGEEHDDCANWSRWVRWIDLGFGFPSHWLVPEGPDLHLEHEKDMRQGDDLEARCDELRAIETDGYFRIWLDAYRLHGQRWGLRHFRILRAVYLEHHEADELTVRESLRALADLKVQCSLAHGQNLSSSKYRAGIARPEKAHA